MPLFRHIDQIAKIEEVMWSAKPNGKHLSINAKVFVLRTLCLNYANTLTQLNHWIVCKTFFFSFSVIRVCICKRKHITNDYAYDAEFYLSAHHLIVVKCFNRSARFDYRQRTLVYGSFPRSNDVINIRSEPR